MTNGEKYKTAAERLEHFRKFCDDKHCSCCPLSNKSVWQCGIMWLDLELEEEKPLPCPFCGGDTEANCGHLTHGSVNHWVDCVNPDCMYMSGHAKSEAEAIAMHNAVCRAVAKAKGGEE